MRRYPCQLLPPVIPYAEKQPKWAFEVGAGWLLIDLLSVSGRFTAVDLGWALFLLFVFCGCCCDPVSEDLVDSCRLTGLGNGTGFMAAAHSDLSYRCQEQCGAGCNQ